MRYLHPVSHHERFVASGVYTTSVVGQDTSAPTTTAATEEWSIHLQPGGSRFIRLDCTPGISEAAAGDSQEHLLAEILQSPEGIVERVDLVWFRRVVTRRISLTIFDAYVQIGYKAAADERQYFEVDIPEGTRLLPPFTLFALGSVNVPDVTTTQAQWIGVALESLASPAPIPPPMLIRSIDWKMGEIEVLTFGRKQITTQVFTHRADDTEFTVWRDQRMYIPVRVTAQSADAQSADNPADGQPRLIKTGELRSIAY